MLLNRRLDRIDPPPPPPPRPKLAPCPGCSLDVWETHEIFEFDAELTFVRCKCGCPSAWHVNGHGPQLIYTGEPEEGDDEYEEEDESEEDEEVEDNEDDEEEEV